MNGYCGYFGKKLRIVLILILSNQSSSFKSTRAVSETPVHSLVIWAFTGSPQKIHEEKETDVS